MAGESGVFEAALAGALAEWEIDLGSEAVGRLRRHYEAMVEANRVMNLTRITDPAEAAVKHYADSLALVQWARVRAVGVARVLDVGTGAGFPSVPVAAARADWGVTAIDSTAKKMRFVEGAARELGLANLHCVHAHGGHYKAGEPFDVVTFRALTTMAKAVPQTARHLAPGGRLVAYKTAAVEAELAAAADELRRAKLRVAERFPYRLVCGGEVMERVLVVLEKG